MKTSRRSMLALFTAAAASSLMTACYVVPARPYHGGYAYDDAYGPYGGVVTVAPPPPQVEVVGVAPFPGAIWINGWWGWRGGRHVWIAGRWEAPRPGYRWEPHMWQREGNGWREYGGRWVR